MADIDIFLSILRALIPVAKAAAPWTESKWDDQAVVYAEMALNSPELIGFLRIVFNDPEVQAASPEKLPVATLAAVSRAATDETIAAAKAAGIPWLDFVQLLPLIIRMLLSVKG